MPAGKHFSFVPPFTQLCIITLIGLYFPSRTKDINGWPITFTILDYSDVYIILETNKFYVFCLPINISYILLEAFSLTFLVERVW